MIKEILRKLVLEALKKAQKTGDLKIKQMPEIFLEHPKEKAHGDWATNVAMILAREVKKPPYEVAQLILKHLQKSARFLEKVKLGGKGFINFYLSRAWFCEVLREIESKKSKYGCSEVGEGRKVQVEFVSANPVGPMHIGHGRWAAFGDTLANVLKFAGYNVCKEFYINDYGRQMSTFGKSVAARYRELLGEKVSFPEDGYQGKYVFDIAREIIDKDKDKHLFLSQGEMEKEFRERAYQQVIEHMKKVLRSMGVQFDNWFSEKSLHDSGKVKAVISQLRKKEYVYDKDGAVWFRSTKFGDEKDRVLIRENGEPTYFAADIAYHKDKLDRGFEKIIDIWGADHHGYVGRMKAAIQALGKPADTLEVILGQLVNLHRGGKPVKMSKRAGEMVTLEELLQEVGRDAVRYFFLMRSTDAPLDFDIELAKEKSEKNPVYYVQYAHARICSLLKYARENRIAVPKPDQAKLELLVSPAEFDLMRRLAEFGEVVERSALARAPTHFTKYAQEVASTFHFFYTKCRVIGNENKNLDQARLMLADATRIVLKNVLDIIGVAAPESM